MFNSIILGAILAFSLHLTASASPASSQSPAVSSSFISANVLSGPTAEEQAIMMQAAAESDFSYEELLQFFENGLLRIIAIPNGHRVKIQTGGGFVIIDLIDDL